MPGRRKAVIRVAAAALAMGLLLAYGAMLLVHLSTSAAGSDSSGYCNHARGLRDGRLIEDIPQVERWALPKGSGMEWLFMPLGHVPGARPNTRVPSYPVGLPAHMLGLSEIAGWRWGPFLVAPIACLLTLVLMVLTGRELRLGTGSALAGAGIFAAWPATVLFGTIPMSDMLATFWVLAAVYFGLLARRHTAGAVVSGFAFAVAVAVRPSNVIFLPVLGLAIPFRLRHYLAFWLAAAPLAVAQALYQRYLYGSALRTGYGGMRSMFKLSFFPERLRHYGYWLGRTLTPLVPIGWAGLAADGKPSRKDRLLLLTWFAIPFVFYCLYLCYEDWTYMRFLLPGIPALILGAVIVARDVGTWLSRGTSERRPWIVGAAGAILLAGIVANGAWQTRRLGVLETHEHEAVYKDGCRWLAENAPPGSPVMCMQVSGAVKYYTDLLPVRYDTRDPRDMLPAIRAGLAEGLTWYALLFDWELETAVSRLPGRWERIGTFREKLILLRLARGSLDEQASGTMHYGLADLDSFEEP